MASAAASLPPLRLHVVTSFFVVRALSGAFSPFGGPLATGAASFNDPQKVSHLNSEQFLSEVSRHVIDLARSGPAAATPTLGSTQANADFAAISAAAERQLEYLHCLLMNLSSPAVHRVLLLVQDPASAELLSNVVSEIPAFAYRREKLVPVLFQPRFQNQQQPHYRDLFSVAKQYLHPTRDLAAVCNSDIHFNTDQIVANVAKVHELAPEDGNTVLGLTRYEECGEQDSFSSGGGSAADKAAITDVTKQWWQQPSAECSAPVHITHAPLIDDYRGSHDAFVFRPAAVDSDDFLASVDHPQNAYQSENIVVYEFMRAGKRMRNPSRGFFRIAHRHASEVRQWFLPEGKSEPSRYAKISPE